MCSKGAVQPSRLGLAETWMWLSLLLASSENPSKLLLFSHPALVITSLLHNWLWKLQVCKGGMRWAARRHRSRTKQPPEQGAAWNWNYGRTHHLKGIPFSLIKTSQKKGLWMCSAFSFGWGLGRRKYCFDEGKEAENLDPKLLVCFFFFSATLYTSSPHEKP